MPGARGGTSMARELEFFFDYGSPFSYLADSQLKALAERTGARVVYRPMLLGGVFKETGNSSPIAIAAKRKYMMADLERWAKYYAVPALHNAHFPINTIRLMRGSVGRRAPGRLRTVSSRNLRRLLARRIQSRRPRGRARGARARGPRPGANRGGIRGACGQGRAPGIDGNGGCPRSVRRADVLRRRPDVLGQRPPDVRRAGAARGLLSEGLLTNFQDDEQEARLR